MHPKNLFTCLLFLVFIDPSRAQIPQNGLDVQHYRFAVEINDSNNMIHAAAEVTTRFTKDVKEVVFDLVKKAANGKGMTVISVTKNNDNILFSQNAQHLLINNAESKGTEAVYKIAYEGEPADGLIISKNKFGNRSFFCDHWPNRAHNWLPCNDHLSDKASVEFIVTAPEHYQVIANGLQVEENNLPGHLKLTHWKEDIALPTKVMAMGAADFAVNLSGMVDCIPVTSWVYPENKDIGFESYAKAKEILRWYGEKVGPYAYKKLANVQSKTIFGALENANAVFYSEGSVNDKGVEGLLAHEIAHQWFGNSATETDWPHLWLSEGFATYMTHLYHEHKYGTDSLNNRMKTDREQIIAFSKAQFIPVVDTIAPVNPMALLNANSYQKGGWVLHMLRRKIGDSLFWKGLRSYYATYAGRNANTQDLRRIFEQVSKQNLAVFFYQWIYTPGQPTLKIGWRYDKKAKMALITIEQTQPSIFNFPLLIAFKSGNKAATQLLQVKDKITTAKIPLAFIPLTVIPDPNTELLFEATVTPLK
jgi:aminopeptidase N